MFWLWGPVVFIVVSRLSFVVRATVIAYGFEWNYTKTNIEDLKILNNQINHRVLPGLVNSLKNNKTTIKLKKACFSTQHKLEHLYIDEKNCREKDVRYYYIFFSKYF